MVVITIIAILMGIGAPSYKYVTSSSRVSSEVNSLLADMQFARSESVREGSTITVCASTDGSSCTGGATGTWQTGWIVFSDANNDQQAQNSEPILRRQNKFSGSDTFTSPLSAVTFNREGFAPNAGTLFTLHDQAANPVYTRCLQLNPVGTVKAGKPAAIPGCT
jgi:type IV fimbrial biogenesis protein FimT